MKLTWLKLDVNILNDEKIKILRSYPDGDSIFTIWIGLLCLGMKSCVPGCLYISEAIPYMPDDLVRMLEVDKKTLEMAIKLFEKYGMILVHDGSLIEIVRFREYQALDKIEREREQAKLRMQKYRERKKIEDVTHNTVTSYDTDKTRIDKTRIDKDIYAENVRLTKKEYDTLIKDFGSYYTERFVDTLSNYKCSNGKKYKSDYRAILSWVVEKVSKMNPVDLRNKLAAESDNVKLKETFNV